MEFCLTLPVSLIPVSAQNCSDDAQDQLRYQDLDGEDVHKSFHVAHLDTAFLRILHQPRVHTGIHCEAQDPLGVLEISAFKKELVCCQREISSTKSNLSSECVKQIGGLIGLALSNEDHLVCV